MNQLLRLRLHVLGLILLGAPNRLESKIAFTGYADLRFAPHGLAEVEADPSLEVDPLLGPLLQRPRIESRSFTIASTGIFAATTISEGAQFLMDITYRDIGVTTKTLRIQYAYLDYERLGWPKLKVGKIILPFGYLNDNRFYTFQRDSLNPPTFVSSILGLPISDLGLSLTKSVPLGPLDLGVDAYAVNGYGPVPGSRTAFRSTAFPGGIQIANNIGAGNSNHEFSFGGRVSLSRNESPKLDIGISHYRGKWDPENLHLFEMGAGHLNLELFRFRLHGEYLLMKARGDWGFESSLLHPHWMTQGFFAELGFEAWKVARGPLVPWLRHEEYESRGDGGGGAARESLIQSAAGLRVSLSETLALKLELSRLRYELPWAAGKNLRLDIWTSLVGVSVTF